MSITFYFFSFFFFFSFKGIENDHFVAFIRFLGSEELGHIFTHMEQKTRSTILDIIRIISVYY